MQKAQRFSEFPIRDLASHLRGRLWSRWCALRNRVPEKSKASGIVRAGVRVGGCIKKEDAWYYAGLLKRLRPELVIEIGVAAGFSSVIALRAMADWGGRLASYDTSESCYYDHNLPVGFYVAQAYPEGLSRWELHTGKDATDAGRTHSGVTVAFIDGDHRHPQPTVDLEALKPAMARDSWFVLHDINLPSVIDGGPDGAARLFRDWKGEKIRIGRGRDNIGAIRWQAEI